MRLFEELDQQNGGATHSLRFRTMYFASLPKARQSPGSWRSSQQKERIDAWTLDLEPDDKNDMMPGSKQAFYV